MELINALIPVYTEVINLLEVREGAPIDTYAGFHKSRKISNKQSKKDRYCRWLLIVNSIAAN